jgi:nitrilase
MWPSEVFAMHSQIENIHIASFPWAPDLAVDTGVTRAEVSIAAARLYAVTGSTWVLMPAVGTATIIAPNGTIVAQVEASDCPVAQPMIYHSIDTTSFVGTPAYQADGEYSYAALKQVDAAFPAYIPQDEGIYIARRENSVREMRKAGPIPLPYA